MIPHDHIMSSYNTCRRNHNTPLEFNQATYKTSLEECVELLWYCIDFYD